MKEEHAHRAHFLRTALPRTRTARLRQGLSGTDGVKEEHTPTTLTFYARPFGERERLAFAKVYQDASGFHLKHPELTA